MSSQVPWTPSQPFGDELNGDIAPPDVTAWLMAPEARFDSEPDRLPPSAIKAPNDVAYLYSLLSAQQAQIDFLMNAYAQRMSAFNMVMAELADVKAQLATKSDKRRR